MHKCWNCGTEHELPATNVAPNREWKAEHLPECAVPWIRECICKELQMAYNRGRNDAALSIIDIATYRVDVLSFCNNNDDCNAMAKGADLVLSDIEYYMEKHNDVM